MVSHFPQNKVQHPELSLSGLPEVAPSHHPCSLHTTLAVLCPHYPRGDILRSTMLIPTSVPHICYSLCLQLSSLTLQLVNSNSAFRAQFKCRFCKKATKFVVSCCSNNRKQAWDKGDKGLNTQKRQSVHQDKGEGDPWMAAE